MIDDFATAAEDRVSEWLISQGWQLHGRNIRLKSGEIDWLGWDNETLVIVEVKASRHSPEIALSRLDYRKRRKLFSLAACLRSEHPEWYDIDIRCECVVAYLDNTTQHWTMERFTIMGEADD